MTVFICSRNRGGRGGRGAGEAEILSALLPARMPWAWGWVVAGREALTYPVSGIRRRSDSVHRVAVQ